MIAQPRMLMLGSTGRNAGKTELACRIIRAFGSGKPIVAVKVTTVRERNGRCPRGGAGCGVCTSLEGNYSITGERSPAGGKDTARMLAAGADRVYWLRVLLDSLEEGFEALRKIIGDAVTVCESNSLRLAVEPGLFLMVRDRERLKVKESAGTVLAFADREVNFDGAGFDLDLNEIALTDDGWFPRWQASAAVLAGGESRRMGRDKSLLPVNGVPLIEHIAGQLRPLFMELRICGGDPGKRGIPGVETIADQEPGQGPLMGILSALEASTRDLALVTACDIPTMNAAVIRTMLREAAGYDAVVPRSRNGRPEPLFSLYRKSLIPVIREHLKHGDRRVRSLFDSCRVNYIDLGDDRWLLNLNNPEDYSLFASQEGHTDDIV